MDQDTRNIVMNSIAKTPVPEGLVEQAEQFERLMVLNRCAIKEVRTKLEILNEELSLKASHNPIEIIKSRVKNPVSIIDKMRRNNWEVSVESIMEHLNDVAGIRVICSFVNDIYDVAEMLTNQKDVTLLNYKDYIETPKENGYRSLHLIVEIPVFLSDRMVPMKVEVQIRTMAMDFWASIEHQLKYKKGVPDEDNIVAKLKDCAEVINQTDIKMQDIYHDILRREEKEELTGYENL